MRLGSLGEDVGDVGGAGVPRGGTPHAAGQRSLVLASDYRVDDVTRMWSLVNDGHSPLVGLGAHHAVLYTSILEPNRVLVTIGIRHRAPVEALLRSPAVFELFDRAGVNDLPAIFVGEVLEKIEVAPSAGDDTAPGVIVGAMSTVGDVTDLMTNVHGGLDRFREVGVRKVWVYRAVDDGHEVMVLLEIDGVASAQRWIDHPDAAAEWMWSAGIGAYPSLFVGKLTHVMNVEADR